MNNKKNRNLKIPQGSDPRWHNRKDIPSCPKRRENGNWKILQGLHPRFFKRICLEAIFRTGNGSERHFSSALLNFRANSIYNLLTPKLHPPYPLPYIPHTIILVCAERILVWARRISVCARRISVCARRISVCL